MKLGTLPKSLFKSTQGACWGFEVTTNSNVNLKIIPWSSISSNRLCSVLCLILCSDNKLLLHADAVVLVSLKLKWTDEAEICSYVSLPNGWLDYAQLPVWFLVGVEKECLWFKATCVINKAIIIKQNNNKNPFSVFIWQFQIMWYRLCWPDINLYYCTKKPRTTI